MSTSIYHVNNIKFLVKNNKNKHPMQIALGLNVRQVVSLDGLHLSRFKERKSNNAINRHRKKNSAFSS